MNENDQYGILLTRKLVWLPLNTCMHMFVTEAIIATGGEAHFSFYMGLIFIPLILVLLSVPAMFIMDLTWNHRKKVILKRARKMGAIEIVDIEIKSNTSPNHVIVDAG